MLSTRALSITVALGLLLVAAAPADAARGSKKADKTAERSPQKAREKKKSKSSDTSLRGKFAKIPAPKVPGAAKLRLEFKHQRQGGGGRLFRASKLKAKGPAGPSFKAKVLASTRKSLRKQR